MFKQIIFGRLKENKNKKDDATKRFFQLVLVAVPHLQTGVLYCKQM
jgi:hypothetical protein